MEAQVIFKYALAPGPGWQRVSMPEGAVVLSVAFQGDHLFLWARVAVTAGRRKDRLFNCAFTGVSIYLEEDDVYIGTAHSANGIVVHVFETSVEEEA